MAAAVVAAMDLTVVVPAAAAAMVDLAAVDLVTMDPDLPVATARAAAAAPRPRQMGSETAVPVVHPAVAAVAARGPRALARMAGHLPQKLDRRRPVRLLSPKEIRNSGVDAAPLPE